MPAAATPDPLRTRMCGMKQTGTGTGIKILNQSEDTVPQVTRLLLIVGTLRKIKKEHTKSQSLKLPNEHTTLG